MAEFIVNPDELNEATKKQVDELIQILEPGTIKIIYQELEGKEIEIYIRAYKKEGTSMAISLKPGDIQLISQIVGNAIDQKVIPRLEAIKQRLDVLEQDVKAIKECPTIKKELENK